jgi:prepilin-type N-terminal cleavage/methylation domain-containing protein
MADPVKPRRDDGFTMPELIVAMGLFLVLLTIFVTGIVSIARASTAARLDAQTSSAVGIAMQRIERSVRYADAVNYPGVVAGKAYVEWRTDKDAARSGVTTCSQLRYRASDGALALRTWTSGAAASTGTWSVLLTGIRGTSVASYPVSAATYPAAGANYPFTTIAAAGGVSNYQGLTVSLATGLSDAAGTATSTTVYAKNSSVDSTSNPIASGGQSATPVCAIGGVVDRP